MLNRIYPPALQLNKANTSETEAPFFFFIYLFQMDLFHLKFMISAIDDFDFDIVTFPFLDGDVPYFISKGFKFLNLFGLLECLVIG